MYLYQFFSKTIGPVHLKLCIFCNEELDTVEHFFFMNVSFPSCLGTKFFLPRITIFKRDLVYRNTKKNVALLSPLSAFLDCSLFTKFFLPRITIFKRDLVYRNTKKNVALLSPLSAFLDCSLFTNQNYKKKFQC